MNFFEYEQPSLKRIDRFSISKWFNEVFSTELKQINNVELLHITDSATRFSAAAVVNSRRKEKFFNIFMKYWIAVFDAPRVVISDDRGEFKNSLLIDLAEHFKSWNQQLLNCHGQMGGWLKDMMQFLVKQMKNSSW